jgi:outer membrane protein insertion porin family
MQASRYAVSSFLDALLGKGVAGAHSPIMVASGVTLRRVGRVLAAMAAVVLALCSSAQAFDPFVVRDIRIEGIERIEAGTVFNYLPLRVGDSADDGRVREAVRALYATGFFRDVRLEAEGDVLVVIIQERPAVASIEFTGVKEFKPDEIKKGLREAGLAEGRTFDRAVIEQAEQEIKRQYLSRGKYAAQVKSTITPLERNRVAVSFAVEEGDVSKIRNINIVGTKAFSADELRGILALQTPGFMSWYTKNDQYSRQKLTADIETLRSFYQNRGYLDFNIESTQVSISPDKQDVFITVAIVEGNRYTVSAVKLAGDLVLDEAELAPLVQLKAGDAFSRERLNNSAKAISDRLGNDGYAFANANPVPEIDRDKREVSFTIMVDPGRRAYVRRINVVGNRSSRDTIVRRELRQLEGAYFDNQKIQRSKRRLELTQFFSEVDMETEPVAGTTDQVDVNVKVKERSTGNVMVGLGFSTADKVVLQGSITQQNLFGTGNALTLQASRGTLNKTFAISFTDPYWTVDGVSLGYDLYDRVFDPHALNIQNYTSTTRGAGLRFGYPITEIDRLNFGLAAEQTRLTLYNNSPLLYQAYVNDFGSSTHALISSMGWARDGRDSALWPTQGTLRRLGGEVSLPVLDIQYYKLGYSQSTYIPLSRTVTLKMGGELGYGAGYGGQPLPFFKAYTAGGIGSLRGYYTGSVGPLDANGFPIGGSRKVVANTEVLVPFPGLGQDRSVRLGAFIDAGQVWNPDYTNGTLGGLGFRFAGGGSFSWLSPVGPLQLSMGYPIGRHTGDRVQHFQFTLGTVF